MTDERDVDDVIDSIAGELDGVYDDVLDGWFSGGLKYDEDGIGYGAIDFRADGAESKLYFEVRQVAGPRA